ncbi:MAG TPA: DNA repair protein RadC [Candidatus Limnocylindria bacterium]|nr:DNA repair protein RadC [Candidatus Limnocylindria bacterium]
MEEGTAAGNPHAGHRARLRERFERAGLDGFAPHEALELLLTYAIPRRDVNPLAHRLLERFGSLSRVLEASPGELRAVEGVGENAAALISVLLPLLRMYRGELALRARDAAGEESPLARAKALLMGETVERFLMFALDARGRVITHAFVSSGDDAETAVYPRLIARELLRVGAFSCVLAHNHPSGLARPSRADVDMTTALQAALEPLGIRLHDHIVVAGDEAFSFRQGGLL